MSGKRPRYRYITNDVITPGFAISAYELKAANQITADTMSAVRVAIPKDMPVKYVPAWHCSSTTDERTLDELNYEVIIRVRGRWKVMQELKGVQPFDYHKELKKYGYHKTGIGYLTHAQYHKFVRGALT